MKKRMLFFFAVVLAMAIALGGCSGDKSGGSQQGNSGSTLADAEPTYGGSLIYGMTQDLVSLDPHQNTDAGTRSVVFNMYEGLVKPTPSGDLEPAVAEDYKIEDDAMTYVFTLRSGITFHNGNPVTVEDVEYSINRYAEAQGENSAFSLAVKSVSCPDDKTIVVSLNAPDSEFIYQMTLGIIPKDFEWDGVSGFPGTGPFKFVSYTPGEKLVLAKNEHYWKEGLPYLDEVTFKFIATVDTAFLELKAGTIDVLNYLVVAQVADLSRSGDQFTIVEGNMHLVHAMFLNNQYGPLQDERVRQAICYAINRDEINQFLFDGKSTIIGSHMIPDLTTWYEGEAASVYSYDIAKAKDLLKQAGYENGFDLVITVPSAYTQHVETAEIIENQLSMIGVRVSIQKVEWTTWLKEVYTNRNYQATVIGFDGKLNPSDWLAKYGSDAAKNIANYSDAEYDALLEKALKTTDTEEKASYYKQMQMNLAQHAASCYIEDPADFVAMNSSFGGYQFYPTAAWDVSCIYKKAQ